MKMQNTMPTEGQFVAVRWENGVLQCATFKLESGKLSVYRDLEYEPSKFEELPANRIDMLNNAELTYLVG